MGPALRAQRAGLPTIRVTISFQLPVPTGKKLIATVLQTRDYRFSSGSGEVSLDAISNRVEHCCACTPPIPLKLLGHSVIECRRNG